MKGYLIFVEGGHTPNVVHGSLDQAFKVGYELAKRNPDKAVMLLQMVKRIKAEPDGEVVSLGSHSPLITVDKLELSRKRDPGKRPILRLNRKNGGSHGKSA